MTDKIIALLALAVLTAFVGILVVFVPEPDLAVVATGTVVLAAYDFYRTLFRND